jgi:SAM-dependent methyltransferase
VPRDVDPGVSRRALFGFGFVARARALIDYEAVTDRVGAAWERDGHEPLLRALEPVAETLVEVAEVGKGARVLDAAAGDGNVAEAALARGAEVQACDLARNMVSRGRARAPRAGWLRADVQELPYPDAGFDAVLSSFGAMLAPRARRTARELVRVTRPRGVVALTAWLPDSLPGQVECLARLPDGLRSPSEWGMEDVARKRLEPLLDDLELQTHTVRLAFPDEDALLAALLRPLGLDEAPELRGHGAVVDAGYLLAIGRRPA